MTDQPENTGRTGAAYTPRLSRRQSLKWMGALSGAAMVSLSLPACTTLEQPGTYPEWPQLKLAPVTADGYGTDPNLITPAPAAWPRLMSESQLALTAVLADLIIPREDTVPSASEVGVVDVVDEWISAPYPRQQEYRALIEPGLIWLDAEAVRRFNVPFVSLTETQRVEIIDEIAYANRPTPTGLANPKAFFASMRMLVVGAFVTSPEGTADIGYLGNVAISGDYPGPTPDAMAHLQGLLEELGLEANG